MVWRAPRMHARLRWQTRYQPGPELQDERGVDRVDAAVSVHVGDILAGQRYNQAGRELQDEGRIDAVRLAAAVHVTGRVLERGHIHRRCPISERAVSKLATVVTAPGFGAPRR